MSLVRLLNSVQFYIKEDEYDTVYDIVERFLEPCNEYTSNNHFSEVEFNIIKIDLTTMTLAADCKLASAIQILIKNIQKKLYEVLIVDMLMGERLLKSMDDKCVDIGTLENLPKSALLEIRKQVLDYV